MAGSSGCGGPDIVGLVCEYPESGKGFTVGDPDSGISQSGGS
jgi:hypothetical protein